MKEWTKNGRPMQAYPEQYESLSQVRQPNKSLEKNLASELGSKFILSQPETLKDIQGLIDNIRARQPVLADLANLKENLAQRMLDFLSGAIYAVDGTMECVKDNLYLFTPSGVSITSLLEKNKKV